MIKRNSIHYRLYDKYSNGCVWDLNHGHVNFCQYSRKVGLGVLSVVGIIIGLSFLALGPLQVLGTVLLWLFTDNPFIPFIGQVLPFEEPLGTFNWLNGVAGLAWLALLIEAVVIGIGYGCIVADEYVAHCELRREAKRTSSTTAPGFFTMWYRSWKDKFCPIMELEKKDDNNESA